MLDYLIVGSGLFGSVFAHEANKRGKKVLVIDKRNHYGGNIYTEKREDINVHVYGPHIFHTNDDRIWNYVNQFVRFNNFVYSPLACYKDKLYNLPFNMNTFYQMWGIKEPQLVKKKIEEQTRQYKNIEPANLEEQAIKLVGPDIYEFLIKGYSEKQWGCNAKELPAFIIRRLPVRFTYDNNYFNDKYQGIPIGGYTAIIDKLLAGIEVKTNTNFFADREHFNSLARKVVYTGAIDEFYNYEFGDLEYRSLRFEHEVMDTDNFQGIAVMNFTEEKVPYTRIIEHKHFEFNQSATTVVTKEYPQKWNKTLEPFYPINDDKNMAIYKQYRAKADGESNVIFGGRLAEYRYYDMHQIIGSALKTVSDEFTS
ncbi:MAG TPA: UDP-galactopyranose mutase [Chitinophagales bacterium]|nr:UDP-galactopyranose mutase [Chitinophagales bacterium]